ncbi:MAG TPA: CsbD family protein [Acidobacteriaceae bacterium]|nr:CsbD family protein [Acidobacteriaceae bacterium]
MNKDQVSGKADQVTGSIKQKVGQAVGNQHLANQGLVDQTKGAAKEVWGNAKQAAHDVTKSEEHNRKNQADDLRDTLSDNVSKTKKQINSAIDQQKHQSDKRRSA